MSADPRRLAESLPPRTTPLLGARRALAHHALRSALAAAFDALDVPACAGLLGPIVPGATLPGGARLPGTSLELDPVEAACSLALLLHWPAVPPEPTPRTALAALFGVADWLARRALMEGRRPLTMGELLTQVMATHDLELELELAAGPGMAPLVRVEIALTAGVAGLLGAPGAGLARLQGRVLRDTAVEAERAAARGAGAGADPLELAEASGRAVRRALLDWKRAGAATAPTTDDAPRPPPAVRSAGAGAGANDCDAAAEAFAVAVARRFPPRQARSILAACADPERLEACPVNGFVALLVTN